MSAEAASSRLIGILALQGDVADHEQVLDGLGAKTRRVRLPEDLDGIDALLLPGGESTAISRLAADFGLFAPIRKLIFDGLPAFGSCAGLIMLADEILDPRAGQEPFGGLHVSARRNAFGRQVDSFEAEVPIAGLPGGGFPAVFIRAPWLESVAPSVEVLATLPGPAGADRVVAVRQGPLLATAFHPELTGDDRIHRLFLDLVETSSGRGA